MNRPAKCFIVAASLGLGGSACEREIPAPWHGPELSQPRTQVTVEQLLVDDTLPFLDLSFFARPAWARDEADSLSGTISFLATSMFAPKDRAAYAGEDLFPAFAVDVVARNGVLIPRERTLIDTRAESPSYWDVILDAGHVWREQDDGPWSRASFPLNLVARYVGEVRNCVASFVYRADAMSNVRVQCSQETAVLDARQLGNVRASVHATYRPRPLSDADAIVAEHVRSVAHRIPTAPLVDIDPSGAITRYFGKRIRTNASTSLGAIYLDGMLYVDTARTRHGPFPYPAAMRHGVFSVTKSLAGALAVFYFAERYGESVLDEPIARHVPAFAELPEWHGVTFSHALNMATGTRAGEDLLYEPLELAPDKEVAISNIAAFGDFPEAPGEVFHYATTNTFVLSYALDRLVREREGDSVQWWTLVHRNVLRPIGAENFHLLHTRDTEPTARIPILGLGAVPTLDEAAKIALLIRNEGVFEGRQLLSPYRIREALGRTSWNGYYIDRRQVYRHSFWSKQVRTDRCTVTAVFMQGLGANHVIILPSGMIVLRFMDENDMDIDGLIRNVERVRPSC